MKRNRNKLTLGASLGILACFIMSMVWPQTQVIAKIGALLLFSLACFIPLLKEQKEGKNISANALFYICVIAFLAYLLFF